MASLALATIVGTLLCPPVASQERRLAPGDIVQLNVPGRPEMSGQFRVAPNGRVTIPGLGEVPAAGLTRVEFGARLQERLQAAIPTAGAAPPVAVGGLETALHPLAPGDSIDIAVEGEPELTRRYLVLDNGNITVLYVGEIQAAGIPLSRFLAQLTDRLREFVIEPVVSISDVQRAPREVYISGAIRGPGRYSVWEFPTLLSLLAGAGGLTEQADAANAMLVRGGEKQLLHLDQILAPDAADETDVPLLANDRIVIPTADVPLIHVTGQVAAGGAQPFEEGERVSAAIARAGGVSPAADLSLAGILRGGQWISVDLEAVLGGDAPEGDVALEPGDVLVVPETKGEVYLVGAVAKPGPYPLKLAGSVLALMSIAGGVRPDGDPYHALLVRGTVVVPLDLHKLLQEGDPALDLELADGDRLVVPEQERTVYVLGQVGRQGAYAVRPGDTYMDLIAEAGGLLPAGRVRKILIVRRGAGEGEKEHVALQDLATYDPSDEQWMAHPGDLIYVPTRQELAKERWLRWATGVLSGALIWRLARR